MENTWQYTFKKIPSTFYWVEIFINKIIFAVDEMYLASLINKGREVYANGTTDPTALPAETILKMVTVNGAKSVLWDDELGSLEVGKKVGIGSYYLHFSSHCYYYDLFFPC